MGLSAAPGYRGCLQVNARYDARYRDTPAPMAEDAYDLVAVGDDQC